MSDTSGKRSLFYRIINRVGGAIVDMPADQRRWFDALVTALGVALACGVYLWWGMTGIKIAGVVMVPVFIALAVIHRRLVSAQEVTVIPSRPIPSRRTSSSMFTAVRIVGKKLQTPVRTYTHPDKARTITVVATCHYGEAGYYQRLYDRIAAIALDGALIHSEGSDRIETVTGELTSAEEQAVEARRQVKRLTAALAARMGWVGQPDPPAGFWQFRDMSTIEIIRAAGPEAVLRQLSSELHLLQQAERNNSGAWLALAMMLSRPRALAKGQAMPNTALNGVLIGQRNRVALADAHATGADLVIVWGAAHTPGFHEDLVAQGYRREGEEWFSVLSLPSRASLLMRVLLGRRLPKAKTGVVRRA